MKFYKLPIDIASRRDLRASAKIILAVIADRIGENDSCWPGLRRLGKDAGLSVAAVRQSIQKLQVKSLLEVTRQGKGKVNVYSLAESVQESSTVSKVKCAKKYHTGVQESSTELCKKLSHNQTDQLNQTKGDGSDFVSLWNSKDRLPKIKTLTDKRSEALKVRMKEKQFAENLPLIIEKVACSDFLCGQGERGWQADCDWLLKNDTNYVKILEGKYDNKTPATTATAPLVRDKNGKTEREKMIERTKAII